jgi:hypothetical protein
MKVAKLLYRNYYRRNNKLLKHIMGSGKLQVHCASQKNYGIAQGALWFHRCVKVVGVDNGGDGSVRECMSDWGKYEN